MNVDYNLDRDDIIFIKDKFPTLYATIAPYLSNDNDKLLVPKNMTGKIDDEFAFTVADYGIDGDEVTDDGTHLENLIDLTFMKYDD